MLESCQKKFWDYCSVITVALFKCTRNRRIIVSAMIDSCIDRPNWDFLKQTASNWEPLTQKGLSRGPSLNARGRIIILNSWKRKSKSTGRPESEWKAKSRGVKPAGAALLIIATTLWPPPFAALPLVHPYVCLLAYGVSYRFDWFH